MKSEHNQIKLNLTSIKSVLALWCLCNTMDSSPSPYTNGTMAQIWNVTESMSTNESGVAFNSTVPVTTPEPYQLAYGELVVGSIGVLIIFVAGVIGNSLIIWSVILSKKLQTSTNAFVVNLSVADLLTCLFLPWSVAAGLGENEWPLPNAEWLCAITGFTIDTCLTISLFSLVLIAVNRLIYLTRSLKYKAIYKPWSIAVMIALTWFLTGGFFITLPLAGIGEFGYRRYEGYQVCSYKKNLDYVIQIFQNIAGLTSLFIIIICYTLIFIHIRRHFQNRKDHQAEQMASMTTGGNREAVHTSCNDNKLAEINKHELQITKNLFIVMCAFIVCWLPIIISNLLPEDPTVYVFGPLFAFVIITLIVPVEIETLESKILLRTIRWTVTGHCYWT